MDPERRGEMEVIETKEYEVGGRLFVVEECVSGDDFWRRVTDWDTGEQLPMLPCDKGNIIRFIRKYFISEGR